jgi:hypothetical protein
VIDAVRVLLGTTEDVALILATITREEPPCTTVGRVIVDVLPAVVKGRFAPALESRAQPGIEATLTVTPIMAVGPTFATVICSKRAIQIRDPSEAAGYRH